MQVVCFSHGDEEPGRPLRPPAGGLARRSAARLERGLTQAPGTGGPGRHTCWLTTLDADGAPHTTGLGAEWLDGSWWFETGRRTRKGRNLERDPRCTLTVAVDEFDLVVSGTAALVTDPATVARLAEAWATGGWPCRVDETGSRTDRGVQRAVGGKPSVARLPDLGGLGDGAGHDRGRRSEPLRLLRVSAAEPARRDWAGPARARSGRHCGPPGSHPPR